MLGDYKQQGWLDACFSLLVPDFKPGVTPELLPVIPDTFCHSLSMVDGTGSLVNQITLKTVTDSYTFPVRDTYLLRLLVGNYYFLLFLPQKFKPRSLTGSQVLVLKA